MFIKTITARTKYTRTSKLGNSHEYYRDKILLELRCDRCDEIFYRDLKHMDRKRISNNYFHVCADCDEKKFAQKKGAEKRKIGDMLASADLPVSKY